MPNNLEINEDRFEELPADLAPASSSLKEDTKESSEQADEELDPLETILSEANSLKELGNSEFQKQRWQSALNKYSEALATLPLRPLLKPSTQSEQDPVKDEFSDDDDDDTPGKKSETPNKPERDTEIYIEGTLDSSTPMSLQSSNEPRISRLRAVLNANTAACCLKLEEWQSAIQAAEASLKDDPNYAKALHRRAQANEKLGTWASLQASLDDYNAISKLSDISAGLSKEVKASQIRLPPLIARRAEADKAEMMTKLKDLGNTVLGKFGMSTENFKFTPNESGGYSMSFQQ
ncbi:hypothetical protein MJO28_009622 [Puccinia striiformis f. sp. tritici]|uniref:Tetratricopeptide repeat protein 1 n=4 Tax=Puccinia striiformis TaxID=27350 RepID=A0A0L0VWZ0_9BASI|nr:hypothetical protein Pst134EA_017517 [Puccinia striiformis f. sp. tritici]KAI9607304.1 hypothetical protein H4Q26_005821 [Puccinia striiformis f. sp. tritici PST-130]KNF03829.1 hypothetical protein PSTG_02922 [Puccinia striiformis f. sp. tritici PST-78]POW17970.1 hypothetical protein PSTT_00040 [Puccinia striiformis]KAH9450908.1 hypothetical protein Pst134EB_018417 [Puccinia striiformis f. sp. tritici]KAH9461208.1 hypothetical protein Pst134EA_017517 [Puccinia striiformis f. sp. tritici]